MAARMLAMLLLLLILIPVIRKALGEQLMYVEAYIRTGAVGSVLGVALLIDIGFQQQRAKCR